MRRLLRILLVLIGCAAALIAEEACAADKVDFIRDIRPILSNTCFKCHGFDDKTRQANLRLDLAEGAMAKTDSGAIPIVPGKSGDSEVLRRLLASGDEQMPPAGSGKSVTPAQIDLIKRWIDEGAEFKPHWSFVTPKRPAVPPVQHKDASRNSIDNFVLAQLEKQGLAPSPAADKVTLIRRVTLDLTGLPPTIEETDAFVADESPEAYAKVVDRLLKSPRYGEHMARYWLDAARYGDTHGLHFDNERSLWPYRDWVIRAFNENKPFDQFTIEQLAGDLLPNATTDQKIATGFTRCNVSTSEGGSIDEEVLVRYGVDRVETTSTVFLGLTLGCAVCHNHKFDPVTQKEFYQLFAFFSGINEAAMDGNQIAPPPIMKLPTPETTAKQQELDGQIAKVNQTIAEELAKISYTDPNPYAKAAEATEFVWIDDAAPTGAQLQGDSEWKFVTKTEGPVFSGEKASTRKAPGLSQHFFTGASPGLAVGEGDKLFAYVYLDPADLPKTIMLQFNDGSWEHRCFWGEDVIAWGTPSTPAHVALGPLPKAAEWVRLEVDAAKVGLNPGASLNGWAFSQHAGTVYWDRAGIVTKTPQAGQSFESLAQWEAVEKSLAKPTAPSPVVEALKVDADKRNDPQKKQIRDHFLENVYAKTKPTFDPLHKQRDDLAKQKADLDNSIPTTMVTAEMEKPRDTFLLVRGQYDKKGDKVEPGVPAIFPPLPAGAPANRLGFAKWLVDPAHPLTARVTVNRFWQQYFGVGIVKTAEDFGSQGELPSHPELLDWLAREFIESGWNVKELQRMIVMSATYRQVSSVTPELFGRDPENRLLARGPRFRLDGEVIRDSALFTAGLLVERPGGRGVRPYQPDGIWEAVAFLGSNTQNYKRDEGDALYRRSLYTFWKRTAPPPAFMTFDAPSREACVVRRARTNTPLQALLLMNDTQYVEAARNLAQKMMTSGGASPEERLTFGFRVATARKPSPEEAAVLARIYQAHLADYQADKAAAEKLVGIGISPRNAALDVSELAAHTMVANLILNLDETVTKE
jgi:hypothetical protein